MDAEKLENKAKLMKKHSLHEVNERFEEVFVVPLIISILRRVNAVIKFLSIHAPTKRRCV